MIHIFGIKNCSTIKKTIDWFTDNEIEFTFHDYKKEPATAEKIKHWQSKVDWQELINKRGTSWRKLSDDQKDNINNSDAAIEIMLENNSIIKRPIIEYGDKLWLGFDSKKLTDELLNN